MANENSISTLNAQPLKKIVIVGGGAAGWLTAGIIAAEHLVDKHNGIELVVIESPDVATIGVGEGTWPSMRNTLKKMGVSETDFIRECDASFKQGSKFIGWSRPGEEFYYHPFTLPEGNNDINLAAHWLPFRETISFADAVCAQSHLSDRYLAPKQLTTPEFAGNVNYGYHLNAGKFSQFLQKHCIDKLGVTHLIDHVTGVNSGEKGDISALITKINGEINGDLFIDCTGFASRLIGEHYQIPLVEQSHILFNDSALAVQIPYSNPDEPIASCTLSTAQDSGWIWDIGLPTRRGVGHVFSSAHTQDDEVEKNLRVYLEASIGKAAAANITPRKLSFTPGYRAKFWHKNCVAVGIAAGFIEPLEATALVLIELSAQTISEQLPANRAVMDITAKRFNNKFAGNWQRIIEFLKLHYVLSERRDTEYWRDHCNPTTMPDGLREQLELWRYQVPWKHDIRGDEMFPWASYQYVLYGMGFNTLPRALAKRAAQAETNAANRLFNETVKKTSVAVANLPTNRYLLSKLGEFSFQKI
ncbi:tryptophan halogenase family protein [Cellvibrio sp. OA-2007]|uniref:tryptophan halogenase family protein n=1 Tax=Cellvibrio sp. OA-2007 TaxID=529823 RepID=UPI000781417C|nr:tryptophan halogenase family protein [Cellvibrio sp. OA-2007]